MTFSITQREPLFDVADAARLVLRSCWARCLSMPRANTAARDGKIQAPAALRRGLNGATGSCGQVSAPRAGQAMVRSRLRGYRLRNVLVPDCV
jgi:hypothetical protein